ncbi:MAG: type II toxin-antitoxin system Phd/YefM family antitoxin [Proteobacteria bacterium]|jgi:prevent-host-death family protein|nr:type II toxin-antitoxin system Phd/YefM family antitoxin [Pseudomonadota bacterium]
MALIVNIHDAKTHFSKLLNRVGTGEEVVIAKAGKPLARLVPINKSIQTRTPGSAKKYVFMTEDFNEPLPEVILNAFEK